MVDKKQKDISPVIYPRVRGQAPGTALLHLAMSQLELSTNLREVSQCPLKAHNFTFKNLSNLC